MIITCYHCFCPLVVAWDRRLPPSSQGAEVTCSNCGALYNAFFTQVHGPTKEHWLTISGKEGVTNGTK